MARAKAYVATITHADPRERPSAFIAHTVTELWRLHRRAISGVCPHCNKRLEIEDVHIERYYAVRKLAICGDVLIDQRGHVVAAVHAANLTIKGKLKGNVRVRGRVRIGKTALVSGDIEAPLLRVENGAELCGYLRIGDERLPSVS